MNKYLVFTIAFSFCLYFKGYGQNTSTVPATPNKDILVVDGSGARVSYETWNKMVKSGYFSLRRKTGEQAYYLHELNEEERARFEEKRKALLESRPKPKTSDAFTEGEKFKGFKCTDVVGNKYDLRAPDGKIYVLNFWFIDCAPCKKEIPELNKLVDKYRGNTNVVFVAFGLDGAYDLKQFLRTMPFKYNLIADGRSYTSKFGLKYYPTHAIIGKDGTIKFSAQGYSSNLTYSIEKAIEEQLAGI